MTREILKRQLDPFCREKQKGEFLFNDLLFHFS